MNINTIKEWFDFVTNKYQKGYFSGDEFTALFNRNQLAYYDFLIGHMEQYQPGRPVPRIGLGMTENVTTKLSPFIRSSTLTVTSQNATKPPANEGGFARLIAMYDSTGKKIDRVEHDRKAGRIESTVLTPANNPFYVEYATTWQIFPSAITQVRIDYLPSKPDDVVWAYNDTSGREVYTETGSENPLWYDTEITAIMARMLKEVGVVLDDPQISNYGQSVINMGD